MYKLPTLATNESGFAFDPKTGASYAVNEIRQKIIQMLNSGMNIEDMSNKISTEYKIPYSTAHLDVLEFVTKLKIYELVEAV